MPEHPGMQTGKKTGPKYLQNRVKMKTVIRLHKKKETNYGKIFYPTYMTLLAIMLVLMHEAIIAGLILFSFWATLIIILAMFDNGFEIIKK